MGNAQSNTSAQMPLERHCRLARAHIAQRPDSTVTLPAGLVVRVLSPQHEDLSVAIDDGNGGTDLRFVPDSICHELLEANDQPVPQTVPYDLRNHIAPIGNTPLALNGGLGWERLVHHNFKGVTYRRSALGNALPAVVQKVESAYIRYVDEDGKVRITIDEDRGLLWGHWRFGTHTQTHGTDSDQCRAARLGFGSPEEVGWMYHQGVANDRQDEITEQLECIKVVWEPGHLNGTMGVRYGIPCVFREHFAEINRRRWELHQQGPVPRNEYPVYTGTDERWAMRPGAHASHLHDHRIFHTYEGQRPVQSEADLLAFRPEWRGRSLSVDPTAIRGSKSTPRPPSTSFLEFADSRVEVGGPWQVVLRQDDGLPVSRRSFTPGSCHTGHSGSDAYMHKINYQYKQTPEDDAPMTWDEPPIKLDQDGKRMESNVGGEVVILRDYIGIPDVIDPSEWPADLIAWRRIWPSLSWEQIVARLPPSVRMHASAKELSNRMQMWCRRAYDKLQMRSWKSSGGRQTKELADKYIEPYLTDWHRGNNTTLGITPGSIAQNGDRVPFPPRNKLQSSKRKASVPADARASPPAMKMDKHKRSRNVVVSTSKKACTGTDPDWQSGGDLLHGSGGGHVIGQEPPYNQTPSGVIPAEGTSILDEDSTAMTPDDFDIEMRAGQYRTALSEGGRIGFAGQNDVFDRGVHDGFTDPTQPFPRGVGTRAAFQDTAVIYGDLDFHVPTEYDFPEAFPDYPTGSWQSEQPGDVLVPSSAAVSAIDPRLLHDIGVGGGQGQLQARQDNGEAEEEIDESDSDEFFGYGSKR